MQPCTSTNMMVTIIGCSNNLWWTAATKDGTFEELLYTYCMEKASHLNRFLYMIQQSTSPRQHSCWCSLVPRLNGLGTRLVLMIGQNVSCAVGDFATCLSFRRCDSL